MDGSSGADKIHHLSLSSTESETQRDRPSHLPTTAPQRPSNPPPPYLFNVRRGGDWDTGIGAQIGGEQS